MKRAFDLTVTLLASVAWAPVLLLSGLAIWVLDGRPILYLSRRRVFRSRSAPVPKLRVMRRDAEKLANRATVPLDGVRFLNIPPDSPLYSGVGRILEQCCLTELPQLFQVLRGDMSLVGNRPLPEDVIAALKEAFPEAEDRFLTKTGLTGPVQLVGRQNISDETRLRIETTYCRISLESYSPVMDFLILLYTVMFACRLKPQLSPAEVEEFLMGFARPEAVPASAFPSAAEHTGP
jgi:lipopolysaccharide/colanic/teichoic acid biosynthesis glycosyltransferase